MTAQIINLGSSYPNNSNRVFGTKNRFDENGGITIGAYDSDNTSNLSLKMSFAYAGQNSVRNLTLADFASDWTINATANSDRISFIPNANNGWNNNINFTGRVIANLGGGNDTFTANYSSSRYNATVYGGTGNDSIFYNAGSYMGGGYNTTTTPISADIKLYGEDGNDNIAATVVTFISTYDPNTSTNNFYIRPYSGTILIDGGNGADRLFGSIYNDDIRGGVGSDYINSSGSNIGGAYQLMGVAGASPAQIDTVSGGLGADIFDITSYLTPTYMEEGSGDYLRITDFNSAQGDRVRFSQTAFNYQDFVFANTTVNNVNGLGMYLDNDSNGRFSTGDDLTVLFQGYSTASANRPTANAFQFF